MIDNKKVLALIPARAGSKGIKKKNIIELCGKPLISYSIEAGKTSEYVDDVVVTTDSMEIAEIAQAFGAWVPFLRPEELASDKAKTIDAVIHALDWLKENGYIYDIIVLLQPTQPLRRTEDIDLALEKFLKEGMLPLASVREVGEHPILMRTINQEGQLDRLLDVNSTIRRQDMPKFYLVEGSIYINLAKEISTETSFNDNYVPYIISSKYSVDIDEIMDLNVAELYLKEYFY